MIWLLALALYVASLSYLELVFYTWFSVELCRNLIEVSIVATIWILAYATCAELTARTRLSPQILVILSLLLSIPATYTMFRPGSFYAGFLMHAISLALARNALSTSVFETCDHRSWSHVTNFLTIFVNLVASALLLIKALGLEALEQYIPALLIATSVISAMLMPKAIVSERTFLSFELKLSMLSSYTKIVDSLPYGRTTLFKSFNLFLRYWNYTYREPKLILVAMAIATLAHTTFSTVLPYHVSETLGVRNSCLVYGVSLALSSITAWFASMVLQPVFETLALLSLLRLLITLLFLLNAFFPNNVVRYLMLVFGLVTIHTLYDLSLYGMYLERVCGYEMHKYHTVAEVATLIGTMMAGILVQRFGVNLIVFITSMIYLISSLLTAKVWRRPY